MSEFKRVKIQSFVESQIPEFLNSESPLFREFLEQYYISQEHQTGVVDLTSNLQKYKSIENFNNETFYSASSVGICTLASNLASFEDTIYVNHTIGFPQKYGLLKIDDEIITYVGITTNSFTGCIRGFCGLEKNSANELFKFSSTDTSNHSKGSQVVNLNILFFQELFKKFKAQFLPGFEDREFAQGINLQSILSRAKDFYITKGTDTSFKILFRVLFNESISVVKPQDYLISPSSNDYLVTNNILVEQIARDATFKVSDSTLRNELKGKSIFQTISNGKTASASIYNVEYRPVNSGDFIYNSIGVGQTTQKNYFTKDLYEISLDRTSFILNFESTKKTKVLEYTFKNSNSILVDSTIGFKKSGTLLVKPKNLSNPIILSYTDKTINEFLNVTGLTVDLDYGAEIIEENFLYTYLNDGSKVEFRLINIISDIDQKSTSNLRVNDKIQLSSFGIDLNDRIEFNEWVYNIPTTHKIKFIDNLNNKIYFYEKIDFLLKDKIILSNPNSIDIKNVEVEIDGFGFNNYGYFIDIKELPNIAFTQVKKVINKASSNQNYFPNISVYSTGIQNSYIDYNNENFYVSASGLPNYEIYASDRKTFVSAGAGTTILNCPNHNFFTGEKIYYVSKSENVGIKTSTYFVTKINDDQIKLSYSNSDLFSKNYVFTEGSVDGDYFVKFDFKDKILDNQKLFKKFSLTKKLNKFFTEEDKSTIDKATGILINGVEIFSPTLYDENIYYGKINSIEIESIGKNYDVINFSGLKVDDIYGNGAIVEPHLTGSLSEVKILSPGIGYSRKPIITLTGGNGSGAVLESNLVKTNIISKFKGSSAVSIGSSVIQFQNNHNFDDGEEVLYINDSKSSITPLVNNSNYFVGIVSSTQLKLYETKDNALSKSDPINFTGIGSNTHFLKSLNSKNTITKIYVKNSGNGYSNKSIKIPSKLSANNEDNGVNTFDHYIFAKNHNFKNEDIIKYSTTGSVISGLSTQTNYYVTIIDNNKFKLSVSGSFGNEKINYNNKKYVKFNSLGIGTHTFSYPPIQLNIEYISGIATTPSFEPIVLGTIDNVFIVDGGKNYGTPDILNYHRRPFVDVSSISSECLLKPIILNGSIIDVQILNYGRGYGKDIDIKVFGKGKYAEIYPIVTDGRIKSVNVLNSGIGYDEKTTLIVQRRGSGAKFISNVFEWKINQVEKNKNLISPNDEGIIVSSKNDENVLEFVHFYPPKILRYKVNNFIDKDKVELPPDSNQNPYKILGWAYDGNPIFGPYGKIDGEVKLLKSSYELKSNNDILIEISNQLRPGGESVNAGFFVQDYVYNKGIGDLDEYNGIFIDDKNLPNINYGYFSTITEDTKEPQYPYAVPLKFKDLPIKENFTPSFNQDIDFSSYDIVRNVGPYRLNSQNSIYELIDKINDNYKQEFTVKDISSSGIDSVVIFESGNNYKVNDLIKFDSKSSGGNSASATVSTIQGKNISNVQVAISTFTNVNFITEGNSIRGITTEPHNLVDGEQIIISNLSSTKFKHLEGTKKIYVPQKSTSLTENLQNQSITGVTTYIRVNDVFEFEIDNFIGIGTEVLKIIDISAVESKLYVNRFDNYSGTHTVGVSSVILLPNEFTFYSEFYDDDVIENNIVYFNPKNTIGIGTTGSTYYNIVGFQTAFGTLIASGISTVGVNTTLLQVGDYVSGTYISTNTTITSIGIGSIAISPNHTLGGSISTSLLTFSRKIFDKVVPPRSIYLPNHKFYTGQPITYNVGLGGTGLIVSETGVGNTFKLKDNQDVYALNLGKNYIGLSTLGFTTNTGIGTLRNSLYFETPNDNIGFAHKFSTKYEKISGTVQNYSVIVSTSQTHGLETYDGIYFNFDQNSTKTIKLKYDKTLRKVTTDLINFNPSVGVNTETNEINIPGNLLKTGDKVVYYTNDQISVGGLSTNSVYYVLKQDLNKIKLCDHKYDTSVGISVTFTSVGIGSTHSFSLINPPINVLSGDKIFFDLSDSSLLNMDLILYRDPNFTQEIERFKYNNNILDTDLESLPTEIYYNLVSKSKNAVEENQLTSDKEVIGNNKIKIIPNTINNNHSIVKVGDSSFKFNLSTPPEPLSFLSGVSTSYYDTNSKTATGPISDIKVSFGGRQYKKNPKLSSINTVSGKGAEIGAKSSKIGKIENLERVKDGFDYPSDITLKPYLSVPVVAQIGDISRVEFVGIVTGGKNYNTAPSLKVLGNNKIKLSAKIQSGSVVGVDVIQNTNDLITPLRVVPIRNSNGYEIDSVVASDDGSTVTLELLNNSELFPLITTGYGNTTTIFPFSEGDKIFIENCRQIDRTKDNINSKDYGYTFFTVSSVDVQNSTISFSMTGLKNSLKLNQNNGESNYENAFGYGFVVNKKDMAEFEMNLVDDLSYISGEYVIGYDTAGNSVFSAQVVEDGWDNEINELRLINAQGELEIGNKLRGEKSLLNGTVRDVNKFNLKATLGVTRDKVNQSKNQSGFLNDYSQRISDNFYYQKFSYAIKSQLSYDKWKEPIRSLVHPSGFKEFSDLDILSKSTSNMKVKINSSNLLLNVLMDNVQSLYSRNNFTLVSEDEDNLFEDDSIERVNIGAEEGIVSGIGKTGPIFGVPLRPYILNKTNKVLLINDISDQFDGSNDYISIGTTSATFNSLHQYYVGIVTDGLNVGDYIGNSQYLIPDVTTIESIGINSIRINLPHRVLSGISTTDVEIKRKLSGAKIVGNKEFELTYGIGSEKVPLYYREFNSNSSSVLELENNIIKINNHNFQTGQKIFYNQTIFDLNPVGSATTEVDNGFSYNVSSKFDSNTIIRFDMTGFSFDSN